MPAVPAKRAQAKSLAESIIRSASDLYEALYEFARIKGWLELGYKSFGAWADEKMPVSRWVAYQELSRANVLGKVAGALGLPISEVSHAASSLPQGEVSAISSAIDDDPHIVDAEIVETEDPVEVVERIRAVVGRQLSPEPNALVGAWAARCRRLPYPDPLDDPTHDLLLEAQDFIRDCLASWTETL